MPPPSGREALAAGQRKRPPRRGGWLRSRLGECGYSSSFGLSSSLRRFSAACIQTCRSTKQRTPVMTPGMRAISQEPRARPMTTVTATHADKAPTTLVVVFAQMWRSHKHGVNAARHEDDELADPLAVRRAEDELHKDGEQQPRPQQPEAPRFNAEHGLLLHFVQLIFLVVQ